MKLKFQKQIIEIVSMAHGYEDTILKESIETFVGTKKQVDNKIKKFTKFQTYVSLMNVDGKFILKYKNKIEMKNPQTKEDFVNKFYEELIIQDITQSILYIERDKTKEKVEKIDRELNDKVSKLIKTIKL